MLGLPPGGHRPRGDKYLGWGEENLALPQVISPGGSLATQHRMDVEKGVTGKMLSPTHYYGTPDLV